MIHFFSYVEKNTNLRDLSITIFKATIFRSETLSVTKMEVQNVEDLKFFVKKQINNFQNKTRCITIRHNWLDETKFTSIFVNTKHMLNSNIKRLI